MIKRIFKFIGKTILWFVIISVLWVVIHKWVPVPATPLMAIRSIEQKIDGKEIVWKHNWKSLDKISKNLQIAVICTEDQNFLKHNGFDMLAIEKAFENNKSAKRIRGGSTISQQTAKNVFLWPNRSYVRKGFEAYFTFLIELIWGKERIMEVYLNSIEMGNGIYGAEAASQYWFNRSAANLNVDKACALAVILPNPRKYRATQASSYIQKRKAWTQRQIQYFGPLSYDRPKDKK
ncbi:MAG: monofunctional biosynthetic peptidoglycan transglycosylase [Winogradskyella sp.]|nr:monofunctional biosynthetic peptidoglycan transglycosylase [Winogradskyella sp.]